MGPGRRPADRPGRSAPGQGPGGPRRPDDDLLGPGLFGWGQTRLWFAERRSAPLDGRSSRPKSRSDQAWAFRRRHGRAAQAVLPERVYGELGWVTDPELLGADSDL